MNLTTIAILALLTFNIILGLLLAIGKVKLVLVRRRDVTPTPQPQLVSVAPIEPSIKKRRGRPRKFTKGKTRHLYLPATITKKQMGNVNKFFKQHKAKEGDTVILHVPSRQGPERSIEVPYPVQWDSKVKQDLMTVLGGWS